MKIFKQLLIVIIMNCAFFQSVMAAQDVDTYRDIDFRDTLHPDSPKKLIALQWNTENKDILKLALKMLYQDYPGFMMQVSKYGNVPIYWTSTKQVDYVDQPAYAGEIYVAFFKNYGKEHMIWTLVHELTHIADSFSQFSYSDEWQALVTPRIKKLHAWRKYNNISKSFSGWGRINAQEQKILDEVGLPSFYSASALAESFAEIVANTIRNKVEDNLEIRGGHGRYEPPADIKAYLDKTIFSKTAIPHPSGLEFLRAKQFYRDDGYKKASESFHRAIIMDPKNFSARWYLAFLDPFLVATASYDKAVDSDGKVSKDEREAIRKVRNSMQFEKTVETARRYPLIDGGDKLHAYSVAVDKMFLEGSADAMMDICNRVNTEFPRESRGTREFYAYVICGNAHYAKGNFKKAIEEYNIAIKLVPYKAFELSQRIGNAKYKLATNENDEWKAHDEAITGMFIGGAEKHPELALQAGKMFFWGTQISRDDVKALKWMKQAYDSGVPESAYYIASVYNSRSGEYYDPDLARRWAGISLEKGDKYAPYIMGMLKVEDGDFEEGYSLLMQAFSGNINAALAAYELGNLYLSRSYSNYNPVEAEQWYLKAAKKNLKAAQYALGQYYLYQANPKSPNKAFEYFKYLAFKGDPLSQYEAGMMIRDKAYSKFTSEELEFSYKFLYLSLNNTNPVKFDNLPDHKAESAHKRLKLISKKLGTKADSLKKQLDAHIKKERAKRPWQERTALLQAAVQQSR